MWKKFGSLLILLCSVALFAACGSYQLSAPIDGAEEKNKQEEINIVRSFVGSYTKDVGVMGTIYGGHLINLYADGNAKIYYAFYGGLMGGANSGLYEGTYTLQNETLDIDYKAGGESHSFHAEIVNGSFRGQIVLGMSDTPDDKTDENAPGLSYYEIPKTAITSSGRAFIGAAKSGNGFCAQVLELNHDTEEGNAGRFSLTFASSDCVGEIGGTFVKDGKNLTFTYDVPAVSDGEILSVVLTKDYEISMPMINEYVVTTDFNIGNIPTALHPTLILGKN